MKKRTKQNFNIVIPMAGRGSRFTEQGYTDSKPFIDVDGKPMIQRVIENLNIEFSADYKLILICIREDYDKYDFNIFDGIIGHNKYDVVILDEVTDGAAQTVLMAKNLINNNKPLLILNSDQMIEYNSRATFNKFNKQDGGIPCFYGEGTDWSYAKVGDDGFVTEVAEKKQISNDATAGYYYWKRGSDFVKYAEQMIEHNDRTNGEFYVAPVYNWAIKDGMKIVISQVEKVYELGTPEYLEEYLKKYSKNLPQWSKNVNDPITYAYLETTNYCNLDCSFCNRVEVIGPLKHMSLEDWGKLLDGIKHHPIEEAKLMGMGEPFLHPNFDEVCRIFKEIFPKCKLIVATNCQYNINDKFRECMKYIDMLYFSIDGYNESYERDRAPAKWSKLIKFLKDFETVNRYDCDVVVNYVVNAYNVYDIEKVDELRVDNNLGMLRLNIAQIWDENIKMSDDIATSGYSHEQLDYLRDNWSENIMGKSKWDFPDCFWVKNGLYTTVEGDVKMCCMNTGAKSFGNLFENSIDEIRLTENYQNVKVGCNMNQPTSHCKNCSYKELIPILSHLGVGSE